MRKKAELASRIGVQTALIIVLCAGTLLAKGRRAPEDEDAPDNFPDYNKMEMHPKHTAPPAPAPSAKPDSPTMASPLVRSTATVAGEDLDHPHPAPPAVPSKDESEPALPDEMINSLDKSPAPKK